MLLIWSLFLDFMELLLRFYKSDFMWLFERDVFRFILEVNFHLKFIKNVLWFNEKFLWIACHGSSDCSDKDSGFPLVDICSLKSNNF